MAIHNINEDEIKIHIHVHVGGNNPSEDENQSTVAAKDGSTERTNNARDEDSSKIILSTNCQDQCTDNNCHVHVVCTYESNENDKRMSAISDKFNPLSPSPTYYDVYDQFETRLSDSTTEHDNERDVQSPTGFTTPPPSIILTPCCDSGNADVDSGSVLGKRKLFVPIEPPTDTMRPKQSVLKLSLRLQLSDA